ncbi:hypothetical protein Tco_0939710 [Tanacetum coccineum]|uniref:Uncharacterized protein n=1 Tax=Tanacetum coccineum TaxID=301880 RepID=A0ABQ5DKW3_9ASTR
MSTSKTYQQSLANVGYENRPPMLERGSYIPWAKDLEVDDLLLHDAEMEVMNMILLSIPNEIYNSVDACTSAKDMWKRVERLMRGTIQNKVDRETRFTNEFDQFVAEPGEALVSVYNLHLAKQLTVDSFDDLFDYLQQFEKLVNASRAKKLEKSHDPLALVANTGSSSRQTSSYYVTHPTSVVNYDMCTADDDHNNSEIPLVFAMLFIAKGTLLKFSLIDKSSSSAHSNTRNQAIIQGDRVNIFKEGFCNTRRKWQTRLMFKSSCNTSMFNATTTVKQRDIMLEIVQARGVRDSKVFHGTNIASKTG